jgi:hypothetical protein
VRLFLDSSVMIAGAASAEGASQAVFRPAFTGFRAFKMRKIVLLGRWNGLSFVEYLGSGHSLHFNYLLVPFRI